MEQIISFENLVVAPYIIERLLDVRLDHQINEHSTFYFKALLPEEKKDSYVKDGGQGGDVSLLSIEPGGQMNTLFQGTVQDVEVMAVQGSYYIEVYAIANSYYLDTMRKSRSFQNKKITYEKLVQQVTADYPGASVKDMVSQGSKTGQLIVQFEETDWEFLKRLASHFHTGLVSDVQSGSIQYYFGIPENETLTLNTLNYSVKQDIGRYLKLIKSGVGGIKKQDFIYYQVETCQNAHIGDAVKFQGQTLYVYQMKGRMEKGVFLYYITLTTKKGMSQPYQQHDRIAGCSLGAKIKKIKNDQVKVSLEIDEISGHNPGEPCFFPYSTIYSSQDGSGWYCMPEIGDHVRIYFPDGTEEHSYAISSVHEEVDLSMRQDNSNGSIADAGGGGQSAESGGTGDAAGGYSGQRDDPNVKSLRNKDGKEIRLTPEGIYIIAGGTIITLLDDGGVSIISDQNIEFKSEKNIYISAEKEVDIMGLKGVELSCDETASIKMKDNVEVIGQEVKAN